jgi:hypothetical protein
MPAGELLGRRARNRALLARQMLLERSSVSVLDAVEHLVGLQAQAPRPPYVGLWTRLETFDPSDLSKLLVERSVVRLALHRGTIHLVSARDALGLRPLLAPVFDRGLRQAALRLGGAPAEAVVQDARGLLEDAPLTFAQLAERLTEHWPDADPGALGQVARSGLALVQVPPRGLWGRSGPAAHTTIEAWLGAPLDPAGSREELLLRYLAAFGPASVADAQAWCGLTRLSDAAQRLRPRLRTFRDEAGRELLDLPDAPRPAPDVPAPVRFLPEWDNVLRAHKDRSHVISEPDRAALRRPNDVVPGTILVAGFVAGTWRSESGGSTVTLHVDPLRTLSRAERSAVEAEGHRLLRWSAPELTSPAAEVVFAGEFAVGGR